MPTLGRSTQTNTISSLDWSTQTMNQLFKITYHGNIDWFGAPVDVQNNPLFSLESSSSANKIPSAAHRQNDCHIWLRCGGICWHPNLLEITKVSPSVDNLGHLNLEHCVCSFHRLQFPHNLIHPLRPI